ncbi:response regulator [Paucibacter sp. APW11]|uniref:Response regulator n=1 Tax=Roseateles aquae TaxID=3077235 RepID=A0ABU3PEG7_9BURK|nr:response regulator [Paucibacter sp. APW11]MDT9000996.1 response regulator [Paucibacter sp. APW11]
MSSFSANRLVLYVEDDRINIVLMEEVFRRLPGWQLECAEDGAQALSLLQSLAPALLLIDMNLPDMNGLQLLAEIQARHGDAAPRCVALSADALDEQTATALAAGFCDYWTKPIDVPRLEAVLRQMLG